MIRWTLDLAWALGFFVLALSSWLVELARCVLMFAVVVPLLVCRVVVAAVDVAAIRLWESLWRKSR